MHQAFCELHEVPEIRKENGVIEWHGVEVPRDDQRWPKKCLCGYTFQDTDTWQVFSDRIYRDAADDEREFHFNDLPPGAMYHAPYYSGLGIGPDGRSLVVILPDGHPWMIDAQSRNCEMPEDKTQKLHHCWTRTGDVPNITVGKDHGPTCKAGGGSIDSGRWHGFLTRGWLHYSREVPKLK